MFCARCDQPILPGEESRPVDHHAASGPGTTVYVHVRLCQPARQQAYPVRPPERHKPRRRR